MSQPSSPIDWSADEYASFGLKAQVNRHAYDQLPLFDKPALVELLDNYPRRWLQAFTMGDDPTRRQDWQCVDIPADMDGETLWQAISTGRLWFNLTHVEEASADYADLITQMYKHIDEQCPHLQNPQPHYSTLLMSSPGAQVYYHLDAEPNMLWHLRGNKDIWVYPAMDTRYASQSYIEDIYAGEVDENLPYDASFDEEAAHFLLTPGDVASWPHNAPHRIVNDNMNVSLATSYYTSAIYKRQYVQLANRFLLKGMGVKNRSMQEHGLIPSFKRFSYRAVNKIRPFTRVNRSASYLTDLQVDPDSPLSLRQLPEKKPASFSVLGSAN